MDEKKTTVPELPPLISPRGLEDHAAVFDPHPELIEPEYLNNFYTRFGSSPAEVSDPGYREHDDDVLGDDASELNSPLRKNQTRRQFKDAIEDAIQEAGLDLGELVRHQKAVYEASMSEDISGNEVLRKSLDHELVAVYKILRKKGYSHYDLVA